MEETHQVEAAPERSAKQGEDPSKMRSPTRLPSQETQQQVNQQSDPDLPAHRIGAVTQKIRNLKILLEAFEEQFDLPATAVKIGYALRLPLKTVGQKHHHDSFPIHLHERFNPAQWQRKGALGVEVEKLNDFVFQSSSRRLGVLPHHPIGQRLLASYDPKNTSALQVIQMVKVRKTLVHHRNFACLQTGAHLSRPGVFVFGGRIDQHKGRQIRLQVQSAVALDPSFAPAVLGPVHAVGHQLDGSGVHQ